MTQSRSPVSPGVIIGIMVAGIVAVVAALLINNFFAGDNVTAVNPPQHAPVATQTLSPGTYQQSRNWFGPWQLAATDTTPPTALVMLMDNGGLDVSSWTVVPDVTWQPSLALDLNAQRHDDEIELEAGPAQRIFRVALEQPFMVQDRPDLVFAAVSDTTINVGFRIVSTSPEWVKAHGQER